MKRHNEQYNTGVAYYSTGPPVPEIMYFTALAAGGSSNPTPVALTLTPADGGVRHTTPVQHNIRETHKIISAI